MVIDAKMMVDFVAFDVGNGESGSFQVICNNFFLTCSFDFASDFFLPKLENFVQNALPDVFTRNVDPTHRGIQ